MLLVCFCWGTAGPGFMRTFIWIWTRSSMCFKSLALDLWGVVCLSALLWFWTLDLNLCNVLKNPLMKNGLWCFLRHFSDDGDIYMKKTMHKTAVLSVCLFKFLCNRSRHKVQKRHLIGDKSKNPTVWALCPILSIKSNSLALYKCPTNIIMDLNTCPHVI